jgi:hypothetical protein
VDVDDHLPEFDEKFIRIEQLGDDKAGIERSLNPSAGEDDALEEGLDVIAG